MRARSGGRRRSPSLGHRRRHTNRTRARAGHLATAPELVVEQERHRTLRVPRCERRGVIGRGARRGLEEPLAAHTSTHQRGRDGHARHRARDLQRRAVAQREHARLAGEICAVQRVDHREPGAERPADIGVARSRVGLVSLLPRERGAARLHALPRDPDQRAQPRRQRHPDASTCFAVSRPGSSRPLIKKRSAARRSRSSCWPDSGSASAAASRSRCAASATWPVLASASAS